MQRLRAKKEDLAAAAKKLRAEIDKLEARLKHDSGNHSQQPDSGMVAKRKARMDTTLRFRA